MSKNTKIADLINYISVDGSGNVVLTTGGQVATQSYVTTAVANLVNSAPTALDTLKELATALNNDANFATTVTNSIATKLSLSGGTLTGALNGTSATFSGDLTLNNGSADGGQLVLMSSGFSNWNIDNYSGSLRAYYNASVALSISSSLAATFSSSVTAGNRFASLIGTAELSMSATGGYGSASYIQAYNTDTSTFKNLTFYGKDIIFLAQVSTDTERMRITSGGSILCAGNNLIGVNTSDGSDNKFLVLAAAGDWGDGRGASIYLSGNERSVNSGQLELAAGNASSGNILFYTGAGVERMRITTGGELVVHTTYSSYADNPQRGNITIGGTYNSILAFQVNGAARTYLYSSSNDTYLDNANGTGSVYVLNGSGTGVYLARNANSWTAYSDERLKIINGNIDDAVSKLMTLRTVNFTWKSNSKNIENLGLIAQDVQKVFPQVIDKNKLPNSPGNPNLDDTEYLGVRYQELVPVLVKAIQELKAENDELRGILNRNNII